MFHSTKEGIKLPISRNTVTEEILSPCIERHQILLTTLVRIATTLVSASFVE
jgi:hypothetical protein